MKENTQKSLLNWLGSLYPVFLLGLLFGGIVLFPAADPQVSPGVGVVCVLFTLFICAQVHQDITLSSFRFSLLWYARGVSFWTGVLSSMLLGLKGSSRSEYVSLINVLSGWLTGVGLWVVYVLIMYYLVPSHWKERWGIFLEEFATGQRSLRRKM